MTKISRSTRSPSKYMSLKSLEEIRDNNYRGKDRPGGSQYDFIPYEVDQMISDKRAKKSDKWLKKMLNEFDEAEKRGIAIP